MDIKRFIFKRKRDFDLSLSMVGVIPFLVFTYLITVRLSTLKILASQIGCIVFCTLVVFMLGIYAGKRMFRSLVDEIMEKNKQAAIAEAALRVGDKINNPLLAIRGNLEIVEDYILENKLSDKLIDRVKTMKDNLERIRQITDKISSLPKLDSSFTTGKKIMDDFIRSS
jgi:signal transduction histidine kinase